jgi:DNA-binding transcriptional regulator GbsR (MarR family)
MVAKPDFRLTKHEKKYIKMIGEKFSIHGKYETVGRIYALLNLKAKTPNNALNQQEIAHLIGKSVSTVSRTLKNMVSAGYCDYVLENNEQDRAERKYHAKRDFKDFILARFTQSLREWDHLKRELTELTDSISMEESQENQTLLREIKLYKSQIGMACKVLEKMQTDLLEQLENHA